MTDKSIEDICMTIGWVVTVVAVVVVVMWLYR
jgi:hypothetical protein